MAGRAETPPVSLPIVCLLIFFSFKDEDEDSEDSEDSEAWDTSSTSSDSDSEEEEGKQYFFVDEKKLEEFKTAGKLIESRSYNTIHGIWTYFTADDGQVNLDEASYLGIGTLESFRNLAEYYGIENVIPLYIEVESGERLERALKRERSQDNPKYAEMCRRFLADEEDFSEKNILDAGIKIRFENIDLSGCVEEISQYIKSFEK